MPTEIAAAAAATTVLKNLSAALSKLSALAERQRSKEINDAVIEVQNLVMQLQDQLFRQRSRIEELEQALATAQRESQIRGQLIARDSVYWLGDDGPFCLRCRDTDGKLQRMATDDPSHYNCPACQYLVLTPTEREERARAKGEYERSQRNRYRGDF